MSRMRVSENFDLRVGAACAPQQIKSIVELILLVTGSSFLLRLFLYFPNIFFTHRKGQNMLRPLARRKACREIKAYGTAVNTSIRGK